MNHNTMAVLSVKNPERPFLFYIEELLNAFVSRILVVDMGSDAKAAGILEQISAYPGCTVLCKGPAAEAEKRWQKEEEHPFEIAMVYYDRCIRPFGEMEILWADGNDPEMCAALLMRLEARALKELTDSQKIPVTVRIRRYAARKKEEIAGRIGSLAAVLHEGMHHYGSAAM